MIKDETVRGHHRHEFEQAPRNNEGTGKPGMVQFMGLQSQTRLSN